MGDTPTADKPTDILSMSDEDFLKMMPPGTSSQEETPVVTDTTGSSTEGDTSASTTDQEVKVEETPGSGDEAGTKTPEGSPSQPEIKEPEKKEGTETPSPEGTVSPSGSETKEPTEPVIDHKSFYDQIMKPFVANGKEIKLNSPEEVIALMQQGANYTRKMQAIAPHRKMLTMMQNSGITEDKLSFLIDLEKGDPAAVQKLLKDKGIDPLQVDTESEPTYRAGNHLVSDQEVAFRTGLEDLSSTPAGQETLQVINNTWDQASKEALWGEPALMSIIQAQRENGIYDRITTELDRRKLLGQIPSETPFIHAYRMVGDDLKARNGFSDLLPKPVVKAPELVAVTTAAPKPVVENGDKVNAASTTRSTSKPAQPFVNPLAMSDEEFKANFDKFIGKV